jgi:predicted dehydrogenase
MREVSRRTFVAAASTAASISRIRGANDRIRLGIVGAGGRGTYLMGEASREKDIEWAAVCDAWDQRRDKAASRLGGGVKTYADYRALLDRQDIDAIIVATWDNTHSQIAGEAW